MIAVIELSPHLAPIAHPTADAFLMGFVSACSLIAALFFLKFWRRTRDMDVNYMLVAQKPGN